MKSTDIITLLNAGFTRAEILAMDQPDQQPAAQPIQQPAAQPIQQPAAQPIQQPAQPAAPLIALVPRQQPAQQPAQPAQQPAAANVTLTADQFNALIQRANAGAASIDVPPAYDMNKVMGDHFKELLGGK